MRTLTTEEYSALAKALAEHMHVALRDFGEKHGLGEADPAGYADAQETFPGHLQVILTSVFDIQPGDTDEKSELTESEPESPVRRTAIMGAPIVRHLALAACVSIFGVNAAFAALTMTHQIDGRLSARDTREHPWFRSTLAAGTARDIAPHSYPAAMRVALRRNGER